MSKEITLILGDQLFAWSHYAASGFSSNVWMMEDHELCTRHRYHKHKLLLYLANMRTFANELSSQGCDVQYQKLEVTKGKALAKELATYCKAQGVEVVRSFAVSDVFMAQAIDESLTKNGINWVQKTSPGFLCSEKDLKSYFEKSKKPFLKTFYQETRKRFGVMLDDSKQPLGGKWSFDTENRKKIPKKVEIPQEKKFEHSAITKQVAATINRYFPAHAGDTDDFYLAVGREQALLVLEDFLQTKLKSFGPYQDALTERGDILFHSFISPYLNVGLITPQEVIDAVCSHLDKDLVNISSVEGFVRQVVGWREFIFGVYKKHDSWQKEQNFFDNRRGFKECWYDGSTGIPPLDFAIQKAGRIGYAHHIERLMVLGNLMLLCEIKPSKAYDWFMEMFVDSTEWVMGPNVFGMALFSDGGLFATKPYICSSNYMRKMGDFAKAPWCEQVDGLYWSFVHKHQKILIKNHRCSMMVRLWERMADEKKQRHIELGKQTISRLTTGP
jgi:deoxyribodipyrimidine photolyase-related protein